MSWGRFTTPASGASSGAVAPEAAPAPTANTFTTSAASLPARITQPAGSLATEDDSRACSSRPRRSISPAGLIQEPRLRLDTMGAILANWHQRDRAAAQAFLQTTHQLAEDQRAELRRRLAAPFPP